MQILAQGKLLLVGGGSEEQGGWSDNPYGWMIEQTTNKRIAIISSTAGSDPQWLVNYFLSLGAVRAVNFEFPNASHALEAGLYDTLMTYDGIFFKGGDQWIYYHYFKNTPVEQAVIDKYQEGGVIGGTSAGMAILGEYTYTAENASLLPWEGLENVFTDNITIAHDFMPLLSGYITDTHFLERGRLPRLQSMMANNFLINQEAIKGIACDDKTAISIDDLMIAVVHGTGGGYIYLPKNNYQEIDGKWSANHQAIHLAQGMSFDLKNNEIVKGPETPAASQPTENINQEMLLCGNNWIDEQSPCALQLAALQDTMIIITGASRITAANLLQTLVNLGKKDVIVLSAIASNNEEGFWKLRNTIRRSGSLIFIENDFDELFSFLEGGKTGELLLEHMHRDGIFCGFFGEDAKLAGNVYCANNTEAPLLAYNGQLHYKPGLKILNSIVIPGAYNPDMTAYYENNSLSGLYAMGAYDLPFSIYLNSNSWVKLGQKNNENHFSAEGQYGSVIIKNSSSSHEPFKVKAGAGPRNNTAYDQLDIYVLNNRHEIPAGEVIVRDDPDYEFELPPEEIITDLKLETEKTMIYPSITHGNIHIELQGDAEIQIVHISGFIYKMLDLSKGLHTIGLDSNGFYLVKIIAHEQRQLIKFQKILKL